MSAYKKYESILKDKFDLKAKEVCLEFLLSTGKYKLDTPLEFQKEEFKKRDFVVLNSKTNKPVNIECEVKTVWDKSGEWQNPKWNLHIPYRKKNSKADLFFIINNNFDTLCIIKSKILMSSKVIIKNTINKITGSKTYGEKFFEIELKKASFFYKKKKAWIKI